MFRILIVEDEKIERETLADILSKKVDGCHEVISAKNGKEALALFREYQPQLVCADINLPGINGLDMIREMKEINTATQYLILSSYNYFEYAQQAIRLGVNDFILKPYNISEFIEVVHHIILKTKKEQPASLAVQQNVQQITPMLERECLYAIVSDEAEIELRRRVHLLREDVKSGFCFIIREKGVSDTEITEYLQLFGENAYPLHTRIHGSLVCFILYAQVLEKDLLEEIHMHLETIKSWHKEIGIGAAANDIADFYRSFLLAREHVGIEIGIWEQLTIFVKEKNPTHFYCSKAESFMESFDKSDEEAFKKELRIVTDELMSCDAKEIKEALDALYHELLTLIQKQYPQIDVKEFFLLPLQLTSNIYQDFPLNLSLNLKKMEHLIEEERFRNTNYLVKEALYYIEQNYRKQIVLADLADYLRVSPFHISRLLSASLHKSFTELVAEKRVEASKVLLKSDERIKEIAGDVGFQGQSYYNKIFKKYTGMTPKEYRNKIKS